MNGEHNRPVDKKIILVKITQRLFLMLLLLLYVNGLLLCSQIKKLSETIKLLKDITELRVQSVISISKCVMQK